MTEKEKMLAGKIYDASEGEIIQLMDVTVRI